MIISTYVIRKKGDENMAGIYKTDVIELKKAMVEAGLDKLIELSEASTIDRNTLSKVVNGEVQPSSNVMDKLVFSLKLTPERAGNIFLTQTYVIRKNANAN